MKQNLAFWRQLEAFEPFCEQEENDRRLMLQYSTLFDDLLTRDNEMAHLTASAWIVTRDQSRVLLAYHNQFRSWAWLGGHADGDGDLLAVALREAQEESGIVHVQPVSRKLFSVEILPVAQHRKHGRYVSAHLHLNATYLLECDASDALRIKPDENSGVKWFRPSEVAGAVSEPEMRIIYQKLMDKVALLY